jgi:Zn finger protein HypA/HybF involved in hydrogenase expression
MHEAGLAEAVASRLRQEGLLARGHPSIRLVVAGGHGAGAAFDEALRFHLALAAPELDVARVGIVHEPRTFTCVGCGAAFDSEGDDASCPACGGPGLAPPEPERVVAIDVSSPEEMEG